MTSHRRQKGTAATPSTPEATCTVVHIPHEVILTSAGQAMPPAKGGPLPLENEISCAERQRQFSTPAGEILLLLNLKKLRFNRKPEPSTLFIWIQEPISSVNLKVRSVGALPPHNRDWVFRFGRGALFALRPYSE